MYQPRHAEFAYPSWASTSDGAKRRAGEFHNPLRSAEEPDLIVSSAADHASAQGSKK